MRVVIHQPDFLPWLGFFHKWAVSDLFVIFDDAQFVKCEWQNRDKIRITDSDHWITIPVLTKGRGHQKINEVEIDNNNNWNKKLVVTFKTYFSKTKNFKEYYPELEEIFLKKHRLLIDLNMELIYWVGSKLKINTPLRFSSENKSSLKSTERLIELLKFYGANEYYTGLASKDYMDEELLSQNGIKIFYQSAHEITQMYNISNNLINYSIIQYLFEEYTI